MQKYSYNVEFKNIPTNNRPYLNKWKLGWMIENGSQLSTRQQNGNDYRVFTLLSIYLLSRCVQISKLMYDQHMVIQWQPRRSIAPVLTKANKTTPTGLVANHMIWQCCSRHEQSVQRLSSYTHSTQQNKKKHDQQEALY